MTGRKFRIGPVYGHSCPDKTCKDYKRLDKIPQLDVYSPLSLFTENKTPSRYERTLKLGDEHLHDILPEHTNQFLATHQFSRMMGQSLVSLMSTSPIATYRSHPLHGSIIGVNQKDVDKGFPCQDCRAVVARFVPSISGKAPPKDTVKTDVEDEGELGKKVHVQRHIVDYTIDGRPKRGEQLRKLIPTNHRNTAEDISLLPEWSFSQNETTCIRVEERCACTATKNYSHIPV
jgi:hypothetical protein